MVLASLRAPRSGVYVLQEILELTEDLNAELLASAWRQVAERYPPLRTSIIVSGHDHPLQRVSENPPTSWLTLDWSGTPADQMEDRFAEFLRLDWERGFNFDDGVPLRLTLIRASEHSHKLIWTVHHVLLDGRSLAIAWQEWFEIYDALRRGEQVRLPEAKAFSEHLDWLKRQDLDKAEAFWRQYFAGLSETTDYVVDRVHLEGVRPAHSPQEGFGKHKVQLSEELTSALWNFAERHNLTVNTLVQGAWAILLARYSDRSDVVFGAPRAGRRSSVADAGRMVGVLINILPLRIAVPPHASLLPWLKQIRERWIALREYEHTPLDKIWEWCGLPRGMPPFDSLLVYDHEPLSETLGKLGGEWRHRTISHRQFNESPLTLVVYGRPLLSIEIVYSERAFGSQCVTGITGHLSTLLRSFVEQPDCSLAELKVLTEREERWLVHDLNQSHAPNPPGTCVHRLFEQQVERTPRRPAFDSAGVLISYHELNRRANQLARFLQAQGAGPEDFIAVCMHRSPEAAIGVLAVLKAGAAFLPLDPRLPPGRLLPMLQDAGAKFLLSDNGDLSKLDVSGCAVLNLHLLEREIVNYSGQNLPDGASPANAAYAIYTSGSSGRPKAVVVTHRALVNHTLAASRVYGLSDSDRRLQFAWMGTDFFVAETFNSLCSGVTLVSALDRQGNSMAEFLRILDQRRITITGIPSSWWHAWVAAFSESGFAPPPSLRAVIAGMERVNPQALETWNRLAGKSIRWFNAYGPTETSPTSTIYEAGSSDWEGGQFVPIGRPLANTQTYVLDTAAKPVPVGVPGELYIGGAGVARGYLNLPELTAEKFLPDPFSTDSESRLYRTGDRAFYLPDGNLVFLGRLDRQVKIRGFRIELDEIETVLAKHPSVRGCAVEVQGPENRELLVAYVTPADGPAPAPAELRRHLSAYLPGHMLPAAFVTLPEMPLTLGGKIDRKSLPGYDPELLVSDENSQEPATPTEKRLAALWQHELGIPVVDTTANFFELGGDSLKAAQLITLIHHEFGQQLPFASLLGAPTIARIAAVLDGSGCAACDVAEWDTVLSLQPHGSLTPLFCIATTAQGPYCFRPLSKRLGAGQPLLVVCIMPKGEERVPTIQELAARACRSIRRIRPRGPYILGGYCFGGTVAFETARQLRSEGEDVRLLALFDTPAPGYPKLIRGHARNWRTLRDVVLRRRNGAHRIGVREIVSHFGMTGQLIKSKILANTERRIARLELTTLVPLARDVARWQERSLRMYQPKPLNVPIAQFIAQDETISARILEDPRLAWPEVSGGDVHVHRVPGAHGTLLGEPQTIEVARILSTLLRNVHNGMPTLP